MGQALAENHLKLSMDAKFCRFGTNPLLWLRGTLNCIYHSILIYLDYQVTKPWPKGVAVTEKTSSLGFCATREPDLLARIYAKTVPGNKIGLFPGRTWYILLKNVVNPNKQERFHIV